METARKKAELDKCRVCGDAAFYSFFGVMSCSACKMFFKRYGDKQDTKPTCPYDGDCEINMNTRHICTSCRLDKCLSSGMQAERIRRTTNVKPILKKTIRLPLVLQLQTSNYFHEDQMDLLKRLTEYDLSTINNIIEALTINLETIPPIIHSTLPVFARNLLSTIYQTAVIIWRSNKDLQSLSSSSDRSLLLAMAINNITCFLASYIFAQHHLYHNRYLVNHLSHLYGSNIVQCHQWTTSFAQLDDPILFKLFLALFELSPISRVSQSGLQQEFIHPKKIIDIEHRYAEVTWKYLVNKYKSYGEAVRRWMQMMRWLLSMSVLVYHSYDVKTHMNDIEEAIEEVEMSLILEEMDELIDGCT